MPETVVAAVGLPFEEAIDFLRSKIPAPASREHASWTETWKEAHARSFAIAGAASDAMLRDFQDALVKAMRNGTTLADFRKSFDDIVQKHGWQQRHEPGWRAAIIYETNMATAFSAGRYKQMTDPDVLEAYPYWQWVHSGARHPRLQHLNWNGRVLKADDPWWNTYWPPCGWHCGCRVRPVSEPGLRRMGRSGPDPAPGIVYRPWTDKSTGITHMVPNGCDPGWGYNVGKAWLEGRPQAVTPPKPVTVPKAAPKPPPDPRPALAKRLAVAGGSAKATDVRVVAKALQRLPASQLEALANGNIRVVACRGSVTDYLPGLKGVRPRGWPPGATWDTVPGLYDRGSGQVVIATERREGKREIARGHGCADLVAHEAGHALDHLATGKALPEFLAARDKDLAVLSDYERQAGEAGPSETWAESFARHVAGRDAHTPALRQFWLDYLGAARKVSA